MTGQRMQGQRDRRGPGVRGYIGLLALCLLVLLSALAARQPPGPASPFSAGPSFPSWDWFRSPIERQPWHRLLLAHTSFSATVMSRDGQIGWAVGDGGAIVLTADGGRTWQAVASGTTADLRSTVISADGKTGWAVGDGGVIVRTADGGRTWQVVTSHTTARLTSTVISADGKAGWAVGDGGAIVRTADGGQSWQAVTSHMTAELTSTVISADGKTGWAVGWDGAIVRTADGGHTWQAVASDAAARLTRTVISADGKTGWAMSDSGVILGTVDGGQTWQAVASDTAARLTSMVISADGRTGWAVGDSGAIVGTADGGQTWQAVASATKAVLNSTVISADGKTGWAVGSGGAIVRTADGGRTWQAVASDTTAHLYSTVTSADGKTGWAVGAGGAIVRTEDGGQTWQAVASNTTAMLRSTAISADGKTGWAVGDGGTIVRTADGGQTWQAIASTTTAALGSTVISADGKTGWAVGRAGAIVRTVDGGQTWNAVASTTRAWLKSTVTSADGKAGWALDEVGAIVRTSDGGRTWQAVASDTTLPHSTVISADGKAGWAVGYDGAIVRTSDGGRTWQAVASTTTASLYSTVISADGKTGWAVGANGAIVRTVDGGRTWQAVVSNTTTVLISTVISADGNTGWAVGLEGAIVRTADGGHTWSPVPAKAIDFRLEDLLRLRSWSTDYNFNESGVIQAFDAQQRAIPGTDRYFRYPAPWYWLAVLLCLGLGLFAALGLDPPPVRPPGSVEDALASEQALQRMEEDKLGYARIAAGLARFMTNPRTEPPQVIAITGPWGQGKSSILGMLKTSLQEWDFSPVWFNAWHHQQNEQMLASLFAHLRKQAMPAWFSRVGLQFRLRLAGARLRPHRAVLILAAIALSFLLALVSADPQLFKLPADLKPEELILNGPVRWGLLGTAVAAMLSVWRLLTSIFGIFDFKPKELVSRASTALSLKSLGSPEAVRYRFAEDFRAFTAAQGIRPPVIFIDDLDRCEPAIVTGVLEVVNFLVSSGRCFVILSLEKRWIRASVELQYQTIATRMDASRPLAVFSEQYLEKLLNIEIPVPRPRDSLRKLLAPADSSKPDSHWLRLWRDLRPWLQVTATLLLFAAAAVGGYRLGTPGPQAALPPSAAIQTGPEAKPGPQGPKEPRCEGAAAAKTPTALQPAGCSDPDNEKNEPSKTGALIVPGQDNSAAWVDWAAPAAASALLIVIGFIGMARRPAWQSVDSPNFVKALQLWSQAWLVDGLDTPRAFKRFANKVRFLAMMCREDLKSPHRRSVWEHLKDVRAGRKDEAQERRIDELSPGIVALAAILELQPKWTAARLKAWLAAGDDSVEAAELLNTWTGEAVPKEREAKARAELKRLRAVLEQHVGTPEFKCGALQQAGWLPGTEQDCLQIEDVMVPR